MSSAMERTHGAGAATTAAVSPGTVSADMTSPAEGLSQLVKRVFRHHACLILLIVIYLAAERIQADIFGLAPTGKLSAASYFLSRTTLAYACLFLAVYVICTLIVDKPENLSAYCWEKFKREIVTRERLLMVLPVVILMPPFFAAFSTLKQMIPLVEPFSWDPSLAEWDRALHAGVHPWEWLHPVLGYPPVTRGLHFFYLAWILVLNGFLFWQIFDIRKPDLRMQFLLTFVLSWMLIGSLGGTMLASAGPVYFGKVTEGLADPYTPLLAYLRSIHETGGFALVEVQDWLWAVYELGDAENYAGISAMPSMHVAMVTLFAIVGWRTHRLLGLLMTLYWVVIMMGSVHLAWHYAIDGYLSALAVAVIWIASGIFHRKFNRL